MKKIILRAVSAALLGAFAPLSWAAIYTVFAQTNFDVEYGAGAAGGTLIVPIGGDGFGEFQAEGQIRLPPFDPSLGTLNDVRALLSVNGDLTLTRTIFTEGTVGGSFDVDTRVNLSFDFPAVDETPFSAGPPVQEGAPLTRPVGNFTATLDRTADIIFVAGYIDIGGSKPRAEQNDTVSRPLAQTSLDPYIDDGGTTFPPIIIAGIEITPEIFVPDSVVVDVFVGSTTNLELDCIGLGGCQAGVDVEIDAILGVQLTYDYTPVTAAPVPLPASAVLFAGGLVPLLRRKRAHTP